MILVLLGLLLLVWLLLQTEPVQNFIIGKVTGRLSKDLGTEVRIDHVSISFFDKMDLDGTLIRDQRKDTLLYAGKLKLRITDWFFFKDTVDLKYIGMENAVIKLHRKDSAWNYQFIIDHFSSPTPKKDTTAKAIAFNIKKVDLKRFRLVKNDEWIGQEMIVRAGSLLLDVASTDLANNEFNVNTLELDRPYFSIENFDGFRPEKPKTKTAAVDTGMYFNAGDLALKIASVKITEGSFASMLRDIKPDPGFFEGQHIRVSRINGTLNQVSFIKDTIRAKVELSAKERSGFELKKLKADYRLTPRVMEFANLDIRTAKSRLGNYYAMRYNDFNQDMGAYIDSVFMDATFRNTEVSSDDIAYFAPALATWKRQASLNGKFYGTVSDFKIVDFFIRSGPGMYASGNFSMKGLPDMDKTTINYTNAVVQTNQKDLAFLYPGIVKINKPDLGALGNMLFRGKFSGTLSNFTADGTVSSALGGLYTKLNMKFPSRGEPYYKGDIQTQQFDIGAFLGVRTLGKMIFKGTIEGRSFDLARAKTNLDGVFESLEFNRYAYKNLTFNGAIEAQKFHGDFKAADPNFDFTSSIQIDLSGDQPNFNILGDLSLANFRNLNFTNADFSLTGLFDLNFSGRNIDEFLGSAKIFNATLLHDSTRLDFDSLAVNAFYDSVKGKTLSVVSNQFEAEVVGQFAILDLPNSFQMFLNRYYPAYINVPATTPRNQRFVVNIITRDFEGYANVINSKLSGLSGVSISGLVNTDSRDSGFYVHANIPDVLFDRYRLENAVITGIGSLDSLRLTGSIGNIQVGDSLYFPNTLTEITSSGDHSVVHITTSASETLNEASLNADVYTLDDGVRINFRPSSFVLNTKKWELEKEGEIVIRKHFASATNVRFLQGFQEIGIESEEDDGGNASNLVVKLSNVNLGDFVPLFTRDPRIEGIANGNVYLRDFYNRFNADASIMAQEFRLNDDSIGIVHVTAGFNKESGKVSYKVISNNKDYVFNGEGYFDTRDSLGKPMYNKLHFNNTRLLYIDQFLNTLFSDLDGYATGDLVIQGDPKAIELLGTVALRDAALTVNYTKVRYFVDSAVFKFNPESIDFGRFGIKDMYNNTGTVQGVLYEKGFKNMRYDFSLSSNKLLLLDTKAQDNTQFYGKAIGKATLSLKGPQENMLMSIVGEVADTSHIFIPTTTSRESADADFIVFKQYGTALEDEKPESETKLSVDFDLTANNKAQIDVILDELTGDIIKATGEGRLRISVPASGNMTMNGRYNIESGKYDFNFQSFLRKPFILRRNAGNFIEWNGDPYKANMKIDAQYTAKNVTFNELLSKTGYNLGGTVRGYRGDVYVIATLTGKLSNPDIKFSFDFPPNSNIENDPDLKLFLNKVENDENEMLKQVTWLIVFGSFSPYGELGSGGTSARNAGINTISKSITNELNKLVSNFLTEITGDKSLQFDVSTSTYSSASLYGNTTSSQNQLDRQSINLKVNQSLLNDKVIITFGTAVDFNISSSAVQTGNFQWLPDISVEFILSRDRKLSAIVFNKSTLDVSSGIIGRRIRQGVSISYSFDFPKEKPPLLDTSRRLTIPNPATEGPGLE